MLVLDEGCDRLFLAKKGRGFGKGKWIGFGGKMEDGETIEETAVREMKEETGAALEMSQLTKSGVLLFTFDVKPGHYLEVHVFKTVCLSAGHVAELKLSDEFSSPGRWFSREEIPYDEMWKDFGLWVDKVYAGKRFRARVHYSDFDHVESYVIAETSDPTDELHVRAGWK